MDCDERSEKNKKRDWDMKIKILVMDVDGTLTDGHIYMGAGGEVMKAFSAKDGYGIANILPKIGVVPAIITGRQSAIVANRAAELHIKEVYQGISDKLPLLRELAAKYGADLDEVAYVGDDLNDWDCLQMCGLSACPADAAQEIVENVDFVCTKSGGHGAVREVIDFIAEETKGLI